MRADRLLSELMLLQIHGKMSASDLAHELEVSERTIYRDMLALNMAGVPIYAEQGAGGGYQLIDGYRTQLTGMSDQELRALFALNVPALLGELGMDGVLNSAMQKLQASIPAARGDQSRWMKQRFYIDSSPWQENVLSEIKGHLTSLQNAIWEDRKVRMDLDVYPFASISGLEVEPYALVTKDNRWYLVICRNGDFSVKAFDEIHRVEVLNESFQRKAEFDLINFWCKWVNAVKNGGRSYEVVVAVNTRHWRNVLFHLRYAYHQVSGDEGANWRIVTLRFDSIHEARSQLIQLGGCVRVISPEPLRLAIMDYAEQIGIVYQPPAESDIGRGSI